MQNNNISRSNFTDFCAANGVERVGLRNIFLKDGKKVLWASSTNGEIRQFYEDCDFALVNGKIYQKDAFTFYSITRVTPAGLKAYQARLNKELT